MIHIHTIASPLHNQQAVEKEVNELQQLIHAREETMSHDGIDNTAVSQFIYIATGGTEGTFLQQLQEGKIDTSSRVYLLAPPHSNALAASMEILSYLHAHGIEGEILHGDNETLCDAVFAVTNNTHQQTPKEQIHTLGIIGKPSDWLISSTYNGETLKEKAGILLKELSIDEIVNAYKAVTAEEAEKTYHAMRQKQQSCRCDDIQKTDIINALRVYNALQCVIQQHQLQGFTLRCFDLLNAIHTTGCWALAMLNAQGIIAGCEGDVPAMLTMHIAKRLTGHTGFMANPSRMDIMQKEIVFAHCTVPLDMIEQYDLDTHFESGIGIGIHGIIKEGPVTIVKIAGDLSRAFVEEGTLISNLNEKTLCRTQIAVRFNDETPIQQMLTHPVGNHHIILKGHHKNLIQNYLRQL